MTSERVPDYAGLARLDAKAFLVLGAGDGQGRQTAHALSAMGAHVACVDVDAARAETVASETGGVAFTADVRRREDLEGVVASTIAHFGRLHGVVNIVGMARWASLVDMPDEDFDWSLDLMLRAAYRIIQIAGRQMIPHRAGSFVFVSSVSGLTSAPYHGAYGAAKAGSLSLVRTAAVELARHEIRVNAIVPGAVATPRVASHRGVAIEDLTDGALTSPAYTSDIAAAALFLSSDLARHITGQAIVVDGGDLLTYPYPISEPRMAAGRAIGEAPRGRET